VLPNIQQYAAAATLFHKQEKESDDDDDDDDDDEEEEEEEVMMDPAALLMELLMQYDSNHNHPSPPALGQRTLYEGGSRSQRHPRNAPNNKGARPLPCEHPNLMKFSLCMIFT